MGGQEHLFVPPGSGGRADDAHADTGALPSHMVYSWLRLPAGERGGDVCPYAL